MNKFFLPLCASAGLFLLPHAEAANDPTILTKNIVELREKISPQGFVHPGISCDAETLSVMREKVIKGVSPWVDHFEGMRRTRFADPNRKPAFVEQIVNDGGISGFAHDAHLAWVQTILYVVTGDEKYRRLPVEILKWYGSRTEKSFFPEHFPDSHIKIGKYVYTMCSAADILRATTPNDEKLAVTQEMIDALQKNCMHPIRKNCIERNDYFMNQHSYAIMGFLASTILGDEQEDYKKAVEWTTVNDTTPNWGRSGSIKHQIRMVERDDRTGETVEPNLQLVEMGRDMPHAEGNLTNLLMMSKTIDFQKTKVDPVTGTVTDKADGVSPIQFLDYRLPKGGALYAKSNMGYGLPWVPTYSETDPNHPDCGARYDHISPRGRGSFGDAAQYYYYKGIGLDMESGPNRYIKAAFDATASGRERARSGNYLDSVHNYGFDFWIGLPATASDAAPDPEKAKRALATKLPPLEVTYEGRPLEGRQIENQFVDLSAHAQPGDIYPGSPNDIPLQVLRDSDGTGYVRMKIEKDPRTMVIFGRLPRGSGLRVRSDSFVKLGLFLSEDFSRPGGCIQELYVPNTKGEWVQVIADVDSPGLVYVQATPLEGPAIVDLDRIEEETDKVQPLKFDSVAESPSITTHVGGEIKQTCTAVRSDLFGGAKWVAGKFGPALRLEGDRQYAKLQDGLLSGVNEFSISVWIKPDKLDRLARIFDLGDGADNSLFLTPTDGKTLKLAIRTVGTPEQSVSGKGPLQAGAWQHVVFTHSGNAGILYVDGKEVGRNPAMTIRASSFGKNGKTYLGRSQSPGAYLAGLVEDFTIFNKALSASEVSEIFTRNKPIAPNASGVVFKFDERTPQAKSKIEYSVQNLPAGAKFDSAAAELSWKPSAEQQGDRVVYITGRADDVVETLPVRIHVARDLQAALDHVARAHDPAEKYDSATEQAFQAALKSRDLPSLQKAADGLVLVNPRLPDGTLDYRVASSPPERGIKRMADNDPFTFGGIWGFDKNLTLDFGNRFKVKSEAFRLLARDGHPSRMEEVAVYGSNDRKSWTPLTETKTVRSPDLQTLAVKEEERAKAYRYLRVFMPGKALPIFEMAEFRIVGERIEDYSPDSDAPYIAGYDDGTFRPDQKLTKAEAVGLLAGLVDDYTDRGAYTCRFVDVSPNAPYFDDVAYMSSKGIGNTWKQPVKYVVGDTENRFHPEAPITRGELASIMSRMQWLKGDNGPDLKDVTDKTPYAAEIRRVVREGWFAADKTGAFRPDAPVTRAEFVAAVNRMIGRTEPPHAGRPSFSDVKASHWAHDEIMKAASPHPGQPNT